MKIYIRKIDNQCIAKQISYTKDILKDFLDNQSDHSTITCIGKQSGEKAQVALLLATDPRFDNSIQKILRAEGDLAIGDLMVMYKLSNRYIVELIKPTDNRHASYLSLFENDRHVLMNLDDSDDIETNSDYADIFNHNVYGIHIKEKNDALSEERPHICLGWSAMGDISKLTSKEDIDNRHLEVYPTASSYSRGQDVGQLFRFINEVSIGDYVVFAEPRICHIGRVISEHYYDSTKHPNQSDDYVNVRDVKWLKTNIKRSDLSRAFHNSLGAGMSFWGINDYKSAVHDLLTDSYVLENTEPENDILKYDELEAEFKRWDSEGIIKNRTTRFVAFGFKYAESIQLIKGCSSRLKEAVGEDNMGSLIDRGKDLYFIIKNHEIEAPLFENVEDNCIIETFDYAITKGKAINMIFYGVPGCGKSYHIDYEILKKNKETKEYGTEFKKENIIRTTFYQDYSNTDFVGQILPKVTGDKVEYIFNPGPFTLALIRAISNPNEKVALIIEEINRGNAPAIFGDIFQLLDRDEETSISEYGIKNVSVIDFLNDYKFEVNNEIIKYRFDEIKIPGNMYIYATMNTSDQNVYTLDTAFTRRWEKEKIKNAVEKCTFGTLPVPGMNDYTWAEFVDSINKCIRDNIEDLQVNEDKQIGAYFIRKSLLVSNNAEKFAYKVFEYLWGDVAKLDHNIFFNSYNTLDELIKDYKEKGVGVFKTGIFDTKVTITEREEENDEQ